MITALVDYQHNALAFLIINKVKVLNYNRKWI